MNFTIADLLSTPSMEGSTTIAGSNGLSREIKGVIFIEFPPCLPEAAFLPVSKSHFEDKDNLLMSSLFAVSKSVDAQMDAIKFFAENRTSGILLFHVGHIIKSIDQRIIDFCNEVNYPLIIIPPTMLFTEVHKVILNHLSVAQMQKLEFAQSIYEQMTTMLLNEKSVDDIVATLSNLINKRVYFYDFNSQCASSSSIPDKEMENYIRRNIKLKQNVFLRNEENIVIPSLAIGQQLMLVPVSSTMSFYGVLVISDADNLGELDNIAISQAKNSLGIISYNKIKMQDFNTLLLHDFINELTLKEITDENMVLQRGLTLGLNVSQVRLVGIVDIYDFSLLINDHSEGELQSIKVVLQQIVSKQLALYSKESTATNFSDKMLILFSGEGNEEAMCEHVSFICKNIILEVGQHDYFEVNIGLGSLCKCISDIKESYDNAIATLKVANAAFGKSKYVYFDDIPLYSMIFSKLDMSLAKAYSSNILNPLLKYDKKNNGELVQTLKCLLECSMSISMAAEKLYVHKNTLLQRKKKITHLLPHDPFSSPYRLQYEIAFMLNETLSLNSIE